MVKKVIAIAGAGAVLLSVAAPVFGTGWWWWPPRAVDRDTAIVNNTATAWSDTGDNTQNNVASAGHGEAEIEDNDGDRYMSTGNARSKAKAVVIANTDVDCGGDCCCEGTCMCTKDVIDEANVTNDAWADAYTGDNHQDDRATVDGCEAEIDDNDGKRTLYTGDARSKAKAYVIVNTDLRFGMCDLRGCD